MLRKHKQAVHWLCHGDGLESVRRELIRRLIQCVIGPTITMRDGPMRKREGTRDEERSSSSGEIINNVEIEEEEEEEEEERRRIHNSSLLILLIHFATSKGDRNISIYVAVST